MAKSTLKKITTARIAGSALGTPAHRVEIFALFGPRHSSAEQAFMQIFLTQDRGFLACLAPGIVCKPVTAIVGTALLPEALRERAHFAIAKAVQDSVAKGLITTKDAEDYFLTLRVLLPLELTDPTQTLDLFYRATREALERCIKGEFSATELTRNRDSYKPRFDEPDVVPQPSSR